MAFAGRWSGDMKKLLLIVLLSSNLHSTQAKAQDKKLHLALGLAPSVAGFKSTLADKVNYGGLSIYTSVHLRFESQWNLGVKSHAFLGVQSFDRKVSLKSTPAPLRRAMQFVSFTPFAEYVFSQDWFEKKYLFINGGYSLSHTSIKLRSQSSGSEGFERKTTLSGDGFDLGVGIYANELQDQKPSFIAFNYQHILPRKQKIIDITDSTDAKFVDSIQDPDLEKIQIFSLIFGIYLL